MPYNMLHTPQTPHTPGTGDLPLLASSPSSVPNPSAATNSSYHHHHPDLSSLTSSDLPSDLNFDPESVINGEGSGQEELNVSLYTKLTNSLRERRKKIRFVKKQLVFLF
jgi:hypothetical protein